LKIKDQETRQTPHEHGDNDDDDNDDDVEKYGRAREGTDDMRVSYDARAFHTE
jgi:hypothetical protein